MNYPLICLVGNAGAGKDHIADLIVKNTNRCAKISLANPLKESLNHLGFSRADLYGKSETRQTPLVFTEEQWLLMQLKAHNIKILPVDLPQYVLKVQHIFGKMPPTVRDFLQILGSETRHADPEFIVNHTFDKVKQLLSHCHDSMVISDLRFRNEVLFFKSIGARVFL